MNWLSNQRDDSRTRSDSGGIVKAQKAPARDESAPNDAAFRKTLQTMLSTPPRHHSEMVKKEGGRSRPKSSPQKKGSQR